MPMTVALNNLVNSSTGVKEYNVHFAGAILAALPTLIVYIVVRPLFRARPDGRRGQRIRSMAFLEIDDLRKALRRDSRS